MKKKGLIVATIVMVLVLAVSLTTATYAWFSTAAEAEVTEITVTVGQSPNLLVGVKSTQTDSVPSSYAEFRTGEMSIESGLWVGDSALGVAAINFSEFLKNTDNEGQDWKIGRAVSYTTTAINDGETPKVAANNWYKAQGTDAATMTVSTVEKAENGIDYIDAVFLVAIGKAETINQTYLQIEIEADDINNIGMAAALHFYIAIGDFDDNSGSLTPITYTYDTTTVGEDYKTKPGATLSAYEGMSYTTGLNGDDCAIGAFDEDAGTWTLLVPIHAYQDTAYATGTGTAKQVRLIMWIEGSDDACVIANAGTGFSINISFNEASTASKVDIDSTTGTVATGA